MHAEKVAVVKCGLAELVWPDQGSSETGIAWNGDARLFRAEKTSNQLQGIDVVECMEVAGVTNFISAADVKELGSSGQNDCMIWRCGMSQLLEQRISSSCKGLVTQATRSHQFRTSFAPWARRKLWFERRLQRPFTCLPGEGHAVAIGGWQDLTHCMLLAAYCTVPRLHA